MKQGVTTLVTWINGHKLCHYGNSLQSVLKFMRPSQVAFQRNEKHRW